MRRLSKWRNNSASDGRERAHPLLLCRNMITLDFEKILTDCDNTLILDHDMRTMYPDTRIKCYIDTDIVDKKSVLMSIKYKELYKRRLNEKYGKKKTEVNNDRF